ncbi:MAG: ATP-binding protein [Fimbriimonadales bacterium]
MTEIRIRPRERDAIIQSLRAGVVPRTGLQHIQVGRASEIESLVRDLDRIVDGGSTCRFIIGDYGSGKTFFLTLVRLLAIKKKLLTAHCDLNPDRRLHATGGQARSLYAELMRNLSSVSRPDGGAIEGVVQRFVTSAADESRGMNAAVNDVISRRLSSLRELVGGYDFADVIERYWTAHEAGDADVMSNAIRWLRAEFATRTDARTALGVRTIIDDDNVYDHLKLFALFVRLAGLGGLVICLDECVNLYKLGSAQARTSNYEQILRILNDSLQGSAAGLGFLFSGTPEFLLDPRRGLYSYPALASRLEDNSFAREGLLDFNAPVIRLSNLTREDFFVLLNNLRHVFACGEASNYLVPYEALTSFMAHCTKKIGDAYFRTPRTTIRAFLSLLSILEQNPAADWKDLIEDVDIEKDTAPDDDDNGLTTIRI